MRRRLLWLLKLVFSLGLLWLLYHRVDIGELRAQLADVNSWWLGAFFLALAANTLLSALKWRLLLAADGILQPVKRLFASFLTGSFFNLFMPSTIGGDAYRIADIGVHSGRTANTAASILADRLTGFLALAICGLVFPFFTIATRPEAIPNWDNRFLLLPATALVALSAVTLALLEQRILRWTVGLLPGKIGSPVTAVLDKILTSVKAYAHAPKAWLGSLALSFLFQFLANTAVFSLSRAMRLDIPLISFFTFIPFITLMEMIPISIFGIGLRDTGYVWFMRAVGKSDADAAALSLLYVVATVVYVSLGGLLFVLRRQGQPRKTIE
jgi:uncharacterized membrane protein YbhN (UPF0104 family)